MSPPRVSVALATIAFSLGSMIAVVAQEPVPATTKRPRPTAAPGFMVLDEATLLPLTGLDSGVFLVAHSHYLAKEYSQAAVELRKAASLMRLARASATAEGRSQLDATIQALETMAGKLDAGDVPSADEFNRSLGLAQLAFARDHYMKANSMWDRKMDVQWAGQHIKAASVDLVAAAKWVQNDFGPDALSALNKGAGLGDRLSRDVDVADEDVRDALLAIGEQLHEVGRSVTDNPPAEQPPGEEQPRVPGWVVVESRPMFALMPQAQIAFEQARDRYVAHQVKDAAKAVRQAVAVLRIARAMAAPEAQDGLSAAITDLDALATDIAAGKIASADRLGAAFARADVALAADESSLAKAARSKKDAEWAGRHLRAAARHLRSAADWSVLPLGEDTEAMLVRSDALGNSLVAAAKVDDSAVADGLAAMAAAVSALSDQITEKQ